MEEPLHDQRIGAYRIIRQLGAGGMGEVYEAEHVALGVRRALKVFSTESEHVEFLRKRFIDEGRILAAFQHPRIVRVYNLVVDEESGKAYFEMDLVLSPTGQPRTLADELQDGVSEEDVVGWFKDICEGLAYIHSQGVVHRDISLDNILIGPDGRAVITDFGIAKIIDDSFRKRIDMTVTVVSKDGSELRMGKGLYMAPELKKGGKVTYASDAYAVGVILFRLLTGAWYAPTTKLDLLPDFEYDWVPVISRLCNVDPEKRLGEGGIAALPSLLKRVDVEMESPGPYSSHPPQPEHLLKHNNVNADLSTSGVENKKVWGGVLYDLFRYLYLCLNIFSFGLILVYTLLILWIRYLDFKKSLRTVFCLLIEWRALVGLLLALLLYPIVIRFPEDMGTLTGTICFEVLVLFSINVAARNIRRLFLDRDVVWKIFNMTQWVEIIILGVGYPLLLLFCPKWSSAPLLSFNFLFAYIFWRAGLRSLSSDKIRWAYKLEMFFLSISFLSFVICVLRSLQAYIFQSNAICPWVDGALGARCSYLLLAPLSPISFCMGLLKCVRKRFVEGSGHLSARFDLALRIFYIGSVFIFYVVFIMFVARNFVER